MRSQLHIEVAVENGRSFLKKAFHTMPFKVMDVTEDKKESQLHLMLMSSSPGILDGDEYEIKIDVEENGFLQLHTQAYQRLFNMKKEATQCMHVHLADGASFCFLPHPSVPHEQSSFISRNYFYLGRRAEFLFGEVLTCGRKLSGEVFLFSKFHSISKIFIENKLVIKENLLMQPSLINVNAIGQMEGFTHQASIIYLQEDAVIKDIREQLARLILSEDIEAGITAAPVNGLIIRMLGNGAEKLYRCMQRIKEVLVKNKPISYAG